MRIICNCMLTYLFDADAAEAEDIKVSEVSEVTAEFDATSLADESKYN